RQVGAAGGLRKVLLDRKSLWLANRQAGPDRPAGGETGGQTILGQAPLPPERAGFENPLRTAAMHSENPPRALDSVNGKSVVIEHNLVKVARLEQEWYEDAGEPAALIEKLRASPRRADL